MCNFITKLFFELGALMCLVGVLGAVFQRNDAGLALVFAIGTALFFIIGISIKIPKGDK